MIGANGVGKTSILDALSLLASSAQGRLNAGISENSGLSAMRTFGRDADIEFGISMAEPENHPLDYALNLRPRGGSYVISRETLSQGRDLPLRIDAHDIDVMYYHEGRIVRPNWEHNPLESSLSQVPKMFRTPEGFREQLASCTFHHGINVEPRSPVRLPQAMRPAPLPGKNGEDLVSCLYYLRETDPDRFEAVEDALKSAFPSFRKLDFPPVATGTLAMTWRDKSFAQPLYTHQLSEGMLRFLWIVTLLQSPGLTALTLIDEPEVSLHPELLSLLAGLLREASSRRSQIFVATHSDRLIGFLKPEEVVVMDAADDGSSTLTWADRMNLDHCLENYSLDDLWRNGRLGGRA